MFYKLIENKRDEWPSSSACTVRELLGYIVLRGQMRDAQVEAIKTYLYLEDELKMEEFVKRTYRLINDFFVIKSFILPWL